MTVLNRFYVSRFGDLERDTARQESVEFAAFVAVGELLARGRTRTVVVKTDVLSDTERKVVMRLP